MIRNTRKASFALSFQRVQAMPRLVGENAICSKGRAKVDDDVDTKRGVNAQRLVFM